MTESCVIQADYANWRPVAGRKVLQLVFEVPIEQTEQVMQRLGVPMPGESKWCAIALLANSGSAGGNEDGPQKNAPKPSESTDVQDDHHGKTPSPTPASTVVAGTLGIPAAKERKPFASLPLSQQAALRCQDKDFRTYAAAVDGGGQFRMYDLDMAADYVREFCGVSSRSTLDDAANMAARGKWMELERRYQAYLTDRQYADQVRA